MGKADVKAQCITNFPYTQDFEAGNGGWTPGGTASDWAWGQPNKSVINAAKGVSKCWITGGLTGNTYKDNESSWLKSPCFNFSNVKHPYIKFTIFCQTEPKYDGASIQYSIDNGSSWQIIGQVNGTQNCLNGNWYNTPTIKYINNEAGWSGDNITKLQVAQQTLPVLAGRKNVLFRFNFGAGNKLNNYNGFAVDDIYIGEAPSNDADFSFSCGSSNTVIFSDLSKLCPTALSWDFGDPASGALNNSTDANPSHIFTAPGDYTVSFTASGPDNAPSTIKKTVSIIDVNPKILTPVSCNGGSNGAVTATISGGAGPFDYAWNTSPVQNTLTATNLPAGTYTLTVSGSSICPNSASITLTEPPAITHNEDIVQPSCGKANGTATINVSGGLAPYTYSWSPNVSTTNAATNIAAGGYTVTLTDKNLCKEIININLTDPAGLSLSLQSKTDATCNGSANGKVSFTATGGAAPYTYTWTPNVSTTNTADNLKAGDYSVLVTDKNGCTATAAFTIAEPAAITHTQQLVPTTCGKSNGSISITSAGGTAPYSYVWLPNVSTTNSAGNVKAGDYAITVTDKNGCKEQINITLPDDPGVTLTAFLKTDATCNGSTTGKASFTATGGTAPYTYTWTPNVSTTNTADNLKAGDYSVLVTDKNGCTATTAFTIEEPAALTHSQQLVPPTCGKSNGSITITSAGGTAPYSYVWLPNVSTTSSAGNVKAGDYAITVTDKNGCKEQISITLPDDPGVTLTAFLKTDATCNGSTNGKASFTATGGTAPYTYTWTPNVSTSNTADNLKAGDYSVLVTDKNGCTATAAFTIAEPAAITHTQQLVPTTCGKSNGSISITSAGGTAPYSYVWLPNVSTTNSAGNVKAGDYAITVTDKNGCKEQINITLPDDPGVTLTAFLKTDATCNGSTNGKASFTATGGTAPYTYTWTPNVSTSNTADNLKAGDYSVLVTDKNGCTATTAFTIAEPAAITHTQQLVPPTCGKSNGSITITSAGGTAPYSYVWLPNVSTTSSAGNVKAGDYAITVTDKNGCKEQINITLPDDPGVTLTAFLKTDATCNGSTTGKASFTATGGTAPYTYTWTPNVSTTNTAANLKAGDYSVLVADKNGCTASTAFTIAEPAAITHTQQLVSPTCGKSNGSITITSAGGTAPYSYVWLPNVSTTNSAGNIKAGNYAITVTDKNGCKEQINITLQDVPGFTTTAISTSNISCNGGNNGRISLKVIGGSAPVTYTWLPNVSATDSATKLKAGAYQVLIADKNGCTDTRLFTLTEPPPLQNTKQIVQPACGASNGSATVNISGGTAPYNYVWNTGVSTTNTASNLTAGTYKLIVTDANNCSNAISISLSNINGVLLDVGSTKQASCSGGNDGSITVNATSGALPYTYAWSPAVATGNTASGLVAGNYDIAVRDKNGCVATVEVTLQEPEALSLLTRPGNTTCGLNNGTANVVVNGGIPPYSYNWSNGGTTASMQQAAAGSYMVAVADANGCKISDTVTIDSSLALHISLGPDTTICYGQSVMLSPGNFVSYRWNDNSVLPVYKATKEGIYQVTVKDSAGCTATDSLKLTLGCNDVYFPTAFTPNNDGRNDFFGPLGNLDGISKYNFKVYDRWGELIFTSSNPYNKWNGLVKGNITGTGIFVWYARYNFNGISYLNKGTVTLIR
jgi:gliding motility-associated-like protein